MSKEIYINDELVDLDESDNPIALTYSVNDLADIKTRQAYSTNSFKLPKTQNNLRICGNPDSASFVGLPPYRKNIAKIVQNGIEILSKGIALITETQKEINVQILSGLINFFDLLDGKSIRDLDLSDLEHDWTGENIANSQTNTEGYIWSVIDYGAFSDTGKIVDALYQRPGIFRHTLISRIISEAGYTASGTIFSDERHLKSIMPFSLDRFVHGDSFVIGSGLPTSAIKNVEQQLPNDDRDFDIVFQDYATTNPDGNFDGLTYTCTEIERVKVTLTYGIRVRDQFKGGTPPSIAVRIFKNVSTIVENIHIATSEFTNIDYLDQVLETEFDLFPGDEVKITARSEPATDRIFGIIYAGAKVTFAKIQTDMIFGQAVQMEATIPDFTQTNFMKDWMQNFALIPIPDPYTKHIRFINLQELYENRDIALDWTDKFINETESINYEFGDYGIQNYGKYREDDNVPDETGWGIMTLDNQTKEPKKDLLFSLFAASIQVPKLDGLIVTQIKKIENPDVSTDFSIKTQPRILMDNKFNGNLVGYDVISVPYFQQAGLPGLGYQELFDEYYPEIQRMLNRPYVVNRPILLKESDIANIDWSVPIYDKNTASYYYLNSINNYIEGEICFVSLIKMV